MAKRLALLLGALGYLLVIWFYIINPYGHTLDLLSLVCPACPIIEGIGPNWLVYFLVFAPVNAISLPLLVSY